MTQEVHVYSVQSECFLKKYTNENWVPEGGGGDGPGAGSEKDFLSVHEISLESRGCV